MCGEKRLLAAEPGFGCVTECGCGTIHLSIGAVSIALHARSLEKLHALVSAALKEQLSPSEEIGPQRSGLRRVLPLQ